MIINKEYALKASGPEKDISAVKWRVATTISLCASSSGTHELIREKRNS
jgi:hypothetical protein